MDTIEPMNVGKWVDDRMAELAPPEGVKANSYRALTLLMGRDRAIRIRRTTWARAGAVASLICLVLALPAARAIAQRLWDSWILKRIEIVKLDLHASPLNPEWSLQVLPGGSVGEPRSVGGIEETGRLAGFDPRLPPPNLINGVPKITVMGGGSVSARLSVSDITAALARAGAPDVNVPKEWEGVVLGARVGSLVFAEYRDITLVQGQPVALVAPAGFPVPQFLEIIFQTLGAKSDEARHLGQRFATNPAWFFGIPIKERVGIREVSISAGTGIIIETFDAAAQSEALLFSGLRPIASLSSAV
jgi:hypothetical protein